MIVEIDGQMYDVPDDATESEIAELLGMQAAPEPMPTDSPFPTATAVTGSARTVPGVIQGTARFAANHPRAAQQAIGAGFQAAASTVGHAIGGLPGAVGGAMMRGVTPTQAAIREGAGRLVGEAPSAARNAGRAMTTINYAKEAGLPLKPTDLVSTGEAARAVDNMADSMGQKVMRLYGPDNRMVVGPEMAPQPKAPGIVSRVARGVQTVVPALSRLSGATSILDLDQAMNLDRGGIDRLPGISQPVPEGAELDALNAGNIAAMNKRLTEQDAQRSQLIARIAAMLGLQ